MADTIKLPAIGIVHSDTAPENTNVWWDDTSIAAPSMADRLKTFDPASKQWQLSSGKVSISNTGGFYGSVAQTADGQVVVIKTSVVGILKGDPDGSLVQAQPGVDYVVPSALNGYVPNSRTITINGVTQDLTTNRTWTVDALPSQAGNNGKYLTTDGFTASWQTISLASYVPTSRTLTINGVTYDLSANRSWTVSGISGLTASRIPYAFNATTVVDSANLVWNNTHNQLQVGGLGVVSSIDVAYFSKVQNNATLLRVLNNTDGTAARASIQVSVNGTATSFVLSEQAASYISSGILEAGKSTFVASSVNGINFGTNVPASVSFWTSGAKRSYIDEYGNNVFSVGALATNASVGFVYLPSMAGAPIGTPGAITGAIPVTIDSTNSLFNFYSGGAWKTVVNSSRQLTINGTTYDLSADRTWTINSLPTQTGNNGKWLTTDGSNASWQTLSGNVSLFTNDAGYITSAALSGYLKADGTVALTANWNVGAFNITASKFVTSGGLSSQFVKGDGSLDSSTYLTAAITSLGGLTAATQTFATGAAGTDFAISSATSTHTFNLPVASAVNTGKLSNTDWSTFNSKVGGSGTSGQIAYWNGTSTQTSSANLVWDNTNTMFRVGGAAAIASTDVANFSKNQNQVTALRVLNTTSGTAAASTVNVGNGSTANGTFGHLSAGYTTAGIFEANSIVLLSNLTFNVGTTANNRYSIWTNNTRRFNIDGSGNIGVGADSSGNSLEIYRSVNSQLASIFISNNNAGNAAIAGIYAFNGTSAMGIYSVGTGFSTSGINVANAGVLTTASAAGMNIGPTSSAQLSFWTNNTKRATIDANGNNIFTNGALATNATNGFTYIPSCAGIPTGVPTAVTGGVPLVADSTNNKVYAYMDGAWINSQTPGVQSVTSSATVTPTSSNDMVVITAQAAGLTLANPTGTFTQGQSLMIRIKDNGTSRSIAYDTKYRGVGITAPTATTVNKTIYLGVIYNSTDDKFDVLGVNIES